ncbi:hypothetical protein N9L92_00440 [Saprospiraceae bacterium]|nr:hypothetical protein [Saprospiraceae bacterium]
MFSLPYFNKSHIDLKGDEVFTRGSFIESYEKPNNIDLALYSLDTFYVEVYLLKGKGLNVVDVKGISVDDAICKYCI